MGSWRGDPFKVEAGAGDAVGFFVKAQHRAIGQHSEVGVGGFSGIEHFVDRPGFSIVAAEFDAKVLTLAAARGGFLSVFVE